MTVTTNILQRTFRIRCRENTGTCFTVDVDGKHYLITAKHIVDAIQNDEAVDIFHDGTWKPVQIELVGHGPGNVDVTVLAPQVIGFSPTYELTLKKEGVILGEDLYFLGFPYGWGIELRSDFNADFPLPFIKKAVFSAGTENFGPMFLDGHNNPGFSGGPVARRGTKEEQAVIGVISGYRFDRQHVLDEHGKETPHTYDTNTGIIVAHDIKHVLTIIEKNPIGRPIN